MMISRGVKQLAMVAGLLMMLPGLAMVPGFLCAGLVAVFDSDPEAFAPALGMFAGLVVLLGGGWSVFWHGYRSLRNKPSTALHFPAAWVFAGVFALTLALGLLTALESVAGLLFPPTLVFAAALPPLAAVSWFANRQAGGITWRRGLTAFIGGGTVGVGIAIVLEILLPAIVLALVFGLADPVLDELDWLFNALAGERIAEAVTSRAFLILFIQVAIIAPLAEELAKPLITLPLLRHLSRRDTFLIGAFAGAGFAALENVIYAGFGFAFWGGILLVRALGGAIHPLGAGLTALGWRDVLLGKPNAGRNLLARFGLAAGMHALWNGGSLLVLTLAGAQFFGDLPPEIDVLGLSAAGTTLALLVILGLIALWLGRNAVRQFEPETESKMTPSDFTISNRSAALWGLTCLAAVVPAGVAGLQLLLK